MNTSNLTGHSFREADLIEGRALTTDWRGKIEYAFDAGIAIGTFLDALKAGRLLARKCYQCDRVMIPPRMFCERCFRPTDEWVELADTGRVNTFSVSFTNWDASRRTTPQIPAVIEIDGASEGMGILHLLGEVGETLDDILGNVKIGMRVQAVWKPVQERDGSTTDILYFRPVTQEPIADDVHQPLIIHHSPLTKKVFGDWPIWHRYTFGVAGERFFRESKDNARLVASVCSKCGSAFLPPSLYCEDCFVEMTAYQPVEVPGIVDSFTVLHVSLEGARHDTQPIVVALVRWDGVKGGWLAPLLNIISKDVQIGMRVVPVFAGERTGCVSDLVGFERA